MLLRRRIILPFTLALVAARPGAAQAQPSVPGELVRALLTASELVVGRVPAGFPAELVPAGGRVLGGFQSGTRGSVLATAVPQDPAAADEAARRALLGAGWTDPYAAQEQRGFVESRREPRYLCRGSETVSFSSSAAPGGGSYLRIEYYDTDRPSVCSLRTSTMGADPWRDVPVPTLNMPAGATTVNTSMGTRGGPGATGATVGARIRSGMGANELAGAFERQLRQAGWTPAPPTGDAGVTVQTYRMRGADGKEWFGVLTAVALPDSQIRDVEFAVSALPAQ
ncbi:MAG TPA: hypothetical protein VGB15_07450 [Longimicrobium sp.]|jgi:hypothetical protein